MLDFVLSTVYVATILRLVIREIIKYKRGNYNPLIFRFYEKGEKKFLDFLTPLILYFSLIFIDSRFVSGILVLGGLLLVGIVISILNYKYDGPIKRRKVIIQTLVLDLFILVLLFMFRNEIIDVFLHKKINL